MTASLEITQRYGKALSPSGQRPDDAPEWIDEIDNPYLQGVFAPTRIEESSDDLVIEGEIPKDLCGGYFRNGTNPRFKPNNRYHWFDGDGMVHGITFKDGKVSFCNKWVRTQGFELEDKEQESIWPGVLGPFDFSKPLGPIKDTGNTDLIFYNNKLGAIWYESGKIYQLDPHTLETVGVEDINGQLKMPVSAHSKVDLNTGELVLFSYGIKPPYMQYAVVSPEGNVHSVDIDLPGPRRPHDIGMTSNYSILHDFPIFFDPEHFKRTGKRVPLFHPDVPTRFGVIPRHGNNEDVKWFEFKPCYMLHTVNCWEEGDWIVQVGCRTDDPRWKANPEDGELGSMIAFLTLQANLYEWRMNIKTGETQERHLDKTNMEFPTINRFMLGKQNRYSYLQYIPYEAPATFDALVKYDIQTGEMQRWDYGDHVFGSEAPFAPKVGWQDEDDGYVVSFVTDANTWKSQCLIFDAKDISKGPITRIHLPSRLSAGFHALWVPGEHLFAGA